MTAPLILTLDLDAASFARLDALRRAHFPADLNVVPAHVTLFHALPGDAEADVVADIEEVTRGESPFAVAFPSVRFLGKGVAVLVEAPRLAAVRNALAARWSAALTSQDRQPHRPHVTVQNKVTPADARVLYEHLAAGWQPFAGTADGLRLWRYAGGPWQPAGRFAFGG